MERQVRRLMLPAVCALLMLCNFQCLLTTGFHNARILDRGETKTTVDLTGAYDYGAIGREAYLSTGAQYRLGIAPRFDLGVRAAYYGSLSDSRRQGPFIGAIPRIGLLEDRLALAFPAYFYYTDGYAGGQFDARVICSRFFGTGSDFTVTPLATLTVSGYVAFGFGVNFGAGLALRDLPVTLRPEIGIVTLVTDDWIPVVSYGMGCEF